MDIQGRYEALREQRQTTLSSLKISVRTVVILRLLTFFLLIGSVWGVFRWGAWMWAATATLAVLFLFLVKRHARLSIQKKRAQRFIERTDAELKVLSRDLSGMPDVGEGESEHDYALDLDLFGERSVYRLINRAWTPLGKDLVRKHFLTAPVKTNEFAEWHESVKALSKSDEHRLEMLSAASLVESSKKDMLQIDNWVSQAPEFDPSSKRVLLILAPIYAVAILTAYFLGFMPVALLLGAFVLPLAIAGSHLQASGKIYDSVGKQAGVFEAFSYVIQKMEEAPSSQQIDALKSRIQDAQSALKQLSGILSSYDQRNNILVAVVTNALYLSEVRNACNVLKWKAKHGAQLTNWFEAIGQYELLLSLGSFHANFENELNFPSKLSGTTGVEAEEMKHPMLLGTHVIANPISLNPKQQALIITGANMAGKSTYLRTIGVNVLLAKMGAPVPAKSFKLSDVRLFTSMRTTDSLDSGTSYFMAELKRLSQLIHLEDDRPILALLDEILKGTNSLDKEQGSRAFVKRLLSKDMFVVVATHDVSLCTLKEEYPDQLNNYHFASDISGGDLSFDYKLHDGVCDTMNATYLMRSMGLIDS